MEQPPSEMPLSSWRLLGLQTAAGLRPAGKAFGLSKLFFVRVLKWVGANFWGFFEWRASGERWDRASGWEGQTLKKLGP